MNRWVAIALLASFGLALLLRVPGLGDRPMHNDEAVNGVKIAELVDGGGYVYDPDEHHGPSLYYLSAAGFALAGIKHSDQLTEAHLRWVALVFGVAVLLLLPLTRTGIGKEATGWAALFVAVSPAMVFYSRYYIHEMLLICFTGLALGAGWKYWETRRLPWALVAGGAIGMMDATKETFVITLIAAGLALATNQAWNRWLDASAPPVTRPRWRAWHLAAGAAVWVAVAVMFFSSFFTNASGPADSIRSYLPWLNRAAGDSPHIHPWHFYFERLLFFQAGAKAPLWSEALLMFLGIVGGLAGFLRKQLGSANASFVRFLALYAFAQTCAYTILSYKTPWCLLNFWQPIILLAGVGAAVLVRIARLEPLAWIVRLVLACGTAHLGWQAWQLSQTYAADQRNPYVYAHTSPHLNNLLTRVLQLGEVSPERRNTVVKVISPQSDYWPLPWHLRKFKNVGYYDQLPGDPYAPIMIVSSKFDAELDEKRTHLMVGYFQIRPSVFLELYVELGLWNAWLKAYPPPRDSQEAD